MSAYNEDNKREADDLHGSCGNFKYELKVTNLDTGEVVQMDDTCCLFSCKIERGVIRIPSLRYQRVAPNHKSKTTIIFGKGIYGVDESLDIGG